MSVLSTLGGIAAGLVGTNFALNVVGSAIVAVKAEDNSQRAVAVGVGAVSAGIAYMALKAAGELLFGED